MASKQSSRARRNSDETCSQEVFRLRRENRLEEALEKGRACVEEDPNDEWNKKALGWVLYEWIKIYLREDRLEEARDFMDEFDDLDVEASDETMHDNMDRLRRHLDADKRTLYKAEQASKQGRADKALRLYRDVLDEQPDNEEAKKGIGWELRNKIKGLARREDPPMGRLSRLFDEFVGVTPPYSESLYSAILADAIHVAEDWNKYVQFVHWWNPALFSDENYQPWHTDDGKTVSSLAQRALRAAAAKVIDQERASQAAWLIDALQETLERGEDDLWVRYDLGRLHSLTGSQEEARERLAAIVREKYHEAWAWAHLAGVYEGDQRLSLLAKSLEQAHDERYVVNTRTAFAGLLVERERYDAAKREIIDVVDLKKKEDHKIPQQVRDWQEADWFEEAAPSESNEELYAQLAEGADGIVIADIPWTPGMVAGHQPASEKGPARTFIAVRNGGKLKDVPVKDSRFDFLADADEGISVRVKVEVNNGRGTIFQAEPGTKEKWSLVDAQVGVVDHVNKEKDVTHVVVDRTTDGLAYHDALPLAREVDEGEALEIRLVSSEGGRPGRVVKADRTEKEPSSSVRRSFSGTFRFPHDGRRSFGFVSDYYVHKSLIKKHSLKDGIYLKGIAVLSQPDENKWKVASIEQVGRS